MIFDNIKKLTIFFLDRAVNILLLLFYFLAALWGMRDLSSLTRD